MKSIGQYIFVIRQLNKREIRKQNSETYLGAFWNIVNPLLFMIIMSALYGTIFQHDIENFQVYFFSGYIIYFFYKTGMEGAMLSIVQNKTFLIHTKIPMRIFIFERVYTALINSMYMIIAFLALIIYYRIQIGFIDILIIPIIALIVLTVFGFGEILAVVYVYFEDMRHLYSIFMTLVMFASAIIFPIERVSEMLQLIIGVTPVYNSIYLFRTVIMYGTLPEPIDWIKQILWCVFALVIGEIVFRKNRNNLVQKI